MGPYGAHMGPIWALMGPYGPCGILIIPSPVVADYGREMREADYGCKISVGEWYLVARANIVNGINKAYLAWFFQRYSMKNL